MPFSLKSFTPLSDERIAEIIANTRPELVAQVGFMAMEAIHQSGEYAQLIDGYKEASDKKFYIETHQQKIAEFLNDCALAGYGNEKNALNSRGEKIMLQYSNFVIGAEAMELLQSYLRDKKGSGQRLCEVVVVKNGSFEAPDGSRKYINIFLQKDQIHSDLASRLSADLKFAQEAEMEKIYIVEPFGTTGGGHAICVAVRKNRGEEAPLVHLFDPSSSLIRNGMETMQNMIANGCASQLIIPATIKKVFEENGLRFDSAKYFNNSEPLQHANYGYCRILACEAANRFSNMTRRQHEELLQSYIYPSPFSGRTEIGSRNDAGEIESISLDNLHATGGYVRNPALGLRGDEVILSHFVEPALSSRVAELSQIPHPRKEGRVEENELDHIRRYQSQDVERKGYNTMLEEKALRQIIGHLFEIVTNGQFLERAGVVGLAPNPFFDASPYFPESNENEKPRIAGAEEIIAAIDLNLPPRNKINRASFDGDVCRVFIYLGEETGKKVVDFFARNEISVEVTENDISRNLPADMDQSLTKIREYAIEIPRERFESIEKTMVRINDRGRKEPLEQFSRNDRDYLFYPKPRAEILGAEAAQFAANQQTNAKSLT